jgi:hypothetical protein
VKVKGTYFFFSVVQNADLLARENMSSVFLLGVFVILEIDLKERSL